MRANPKFKANDIIHIREWDDMAGEFETKDNGKSIVIPFTFTSAMRIFCEKKARVTNVGYSRSKNQTYYGLDFEDVPGDADYYFGSEMFVESTALYRNRPLWNKLIQLGEFNETLI